MSQEKDYSAIVGRSASVISAVLVGMLLFVAQETYKEFKTTVGKLGDLALQLTEQNALLRSTSLATDTAHARLSVLASELRLLENRILIIEAKGK